MFWYHYSTCSCLLLLHWSIYGLSINSAIENEKVRKKVGRQAGWPGAVGFPAVEWNQVLQRAWFQHKDTPAELSAAVSVNVMLFAVPLPCSSSLTSNTPFILFTVPRINGHPKLDRHREHPPGYDSSSTMMSSELESSSFIDSDDDDNTSR